MTRKNKYVVNFCVRFLQYNVMFSCVELIVSDNNSAEEIFQALSSICLENAQESLKGTGHDEEILTIRDLEFKMISLLDSQKVEKDGE